jgi:hypothetical protein
VAELFRARPSSIGTAWTPTQKAAVPFDRVAYDRSCIITCRKVLSNCSEKKATREARWLPSSLSQLLHARATAACPTRLSRRERCVPSGCELDAPLILSSWA